MSQDLLRQYGRAAKRGKETLQTSEV